jgi:hypothetical protein
MALRGALVQLAPVATWSHDRIGRKSDKAGSAQEGMRIGAIREAFPHGLDPLRTHGRAALSGRL